MKQSSYPYSASDQLLIFDWANVAGFKLILADKQFLLSKTGYPVATVLPHEMFDRLVAEVAQIAARKINFHQGEHVFLTLKKLQPKTLLPLLNPSNNSNR